MASISSKLDAVTVHRTGAVCVRVATLLPEHGRALRVGGLPLSMDPGSLRARVRSGTARVLDVRPQFDVQLADEVDLPVEQQALQRAQAVVDALETRRERLAAEITELQGLRPRFLAPKQGDPPRQASLTSLLALADLTDAELARRLEQRGEIEARLADALQSLQLTQHRLEESTRARRTERAQLSRVAIVTLSEPAAGELALEYVVPGARWVPSYQLKLERGLTGGQLLLRAAVAQQTGEDWNDVQLALSTASLARRTDVPELKTLKIGRRQASPPRSGWREPPPGLEALFESFDSAQSTLRPLALPTEHEARRARKKEKGAGSAGGAVPGVGAVAAPSELAAAQRPRQASAPRVAPVLARAAAPTKSRRVADTTVEEPMEELEAPMPFEDDAALAASLDGAAPQAPAPTPAPSLEPELKDYARLVMAGIERPAARGRLQPMGEWDPAFAVGVSVQLDVVMVVVNTAGAKARSVGDLAVPPSCVPVAAVDAFDYRYDCRARVDVPSTGRWANVAVASCEVGLTPEYICVPAVEPKVYRTLQVANRGAHALLPGPVDVTAGDEFLMTTQLPAIPPHATSTHRLGLGVEEAIKVARKTSYKETAGGFLGGSTVLPHELEVELHNRLATPALIEVRERVPWVAPEDEKDMKVEEPQVEPPWDKLDTPIDGLAIVRGARRWRVTVQPSQSLTLSAQFTIRIPSDRMIVGGNRRT
jgi:hypothetical protein